MWSDEDREFWRDQTYMGGSKHELTVAFWYSLRGRGTTVLCGPNNSGKSLALKRLKERAGENSIFLGVGRIYPGQDLRTPDHVTYFHSQQHHRSVVNGARSDHNHEVHDRALADMIIQMGNAQRARIFSLCEELLGKKFSLQPANPNNEFSPKFVDVGGTKLQLTSTGVRLVMTMLASCLEESLEAICIDEPEMGLAPKMQAQVARYFFDPTLRAKWFPHLKHIFIATHSHLFLDRQNVTNNHAVWITDEGLRFKQVTSMSELHELQFNLLGNELEAMFLPSAIVIVEGPSDFAVIRRACLLRFPRKRITVLDARTESGMDKRLLGLRDLLGDLQESPYRSRIFFLLDAVHTTGMRGTKEKILKLGAAPENIVVLPMNGIEYYYPAEILREIYHGDFGELKIEGDRVSANGITKSKVELSDLVAEKLTVKSKFGEYLETHLLARVGA